MPSGVGLGGDAVCAMQHPEIRTAAAQTRMNSVCHSGIAGRRAGMPLPLLTESESNVHLSLHFNRLLIH